MMIDIRSSDNGNVIIIITLIDYSQAKQVERVEQIIQIIHNVHRCDGNNKIINKSNQINLGIDAELTMLLLSSAHFTFILLNHH